MQLTYWELKEADQADELYEIRLKANAKVLTPLFAGTNRWPDETVIRKLKARGIQ